MRINHEREPLRVLLADTSYGAMTPCARSPPLVICVESIASWVRKKEQQSALTTTTAPYKKNAIIGTSTCHQINSHTQHPITK